MDIGFIRIHLFNYSHRNTARNSLTKLKIMLAQNKIFESIHKEYDQDVMLCYYKIKNLSVWFNIIKVPIFLPKIKLYKTNMYVPRRYFKYERKLTSKFAYAYAKYFKFDKRVCKKFEKIVYKEWYE